MHKKSLVCEFEGFENVLRGWGRPYIASTDTMINALSILNSPEKGIECEHVWLFMNLH